MFGTGAPARARHQDPRAVPRARHIPPRPGRAALPSSTRGGNRRRADRPTRFFRCKVGVRGRQKETARRASLVLFTPAFAGPEGDPRCSPTFTLAQTRAKPSSATMTNRSHVGSLPVKEEPLPHAFRRPLGPRSAQTAVFPLPNTPSFFFFPFLPSRIRNYLTTRKLDAAVLVTEQVLRNSWGSIPGGRCSGRPQAPAWPPLIFRDNGPVRRASLAIKTNRGPFPHEEAETFPIAFEIRGGCLGGGSLMGQRPLLGQDPGLRPRPPPPLPSCLRGPPNPACGRALHRGYPLQGAIRGDSFLPTRATPAKIVPS